uniref:Uncharacterized protein n=1 Tax=Anopheles atroparvus TaxID=41427 RepID=A0A182JMV8_ANOAO
MPRMKKKVDTSVSGPPPSDLSQTLTAGRSRRTIKPNPRYLNDEMVVSPSRGAGDSLDGSGMSEDDFDMEDDELEHLIVRKSIAPSAPQTGSVPKRRGRPPKNPEAPRTEPVKNLRKEVLKKMDYKTLSISKSRLMGLPMMRDGRRKLEMSIDSVESDSADQDDMEGMEEKLDQSSDELDDMSQSAYKKHLAEKTILERRGSGSVGSKVTAGTTEDDDDDFYNDSDPKIHQAEQVVPAKRPVGRPRKNFPKQQMSPFVRKVLLPGMKNAVGGQPPKRKAEGTESDEDGKQRETQQSKMLRRSYGLKHVNSQHQSQDTDSDDDEDDHDDNDDADESDGGRRKALQRARSFPTLSRGRGGRGSKNSYYMMQKYKQKQQVENTSRLSRSGDRSLKPPTITYVNVKDIMKKSKSATDIRRKMDQEDDTDDDASEMEELNTSSKDDGAQSKTNNQLVATILERKRPITIENLQDLRRREGLERKKKELNNRQQVGKQQRLRDLDASETLTADDIVDFEDMLQKNIVSANNSSRIGAVAPTMRGRGRPSENSRPNANVSSKSGQYKATRGRGMGNKRSMQPPRILNATMKLGEGRPLSKLSATSGNNHYSIDLADPDNNVKLVPSAENSPVKRTPVSSSGGGFSPAGTGTGNVLRAAGNARPAVVRDNQRAMVEFKKKKVTCYERWHVINCKFSDSATKKQSFALSMIGLGNIAATIQMPSEAWSLRTVLEKRKKPPAEGDEIFVGETQDEAIAEEDKANYEPNRIMFRRKAPTPGRYNVQYDRTVIFRNDCYTINIDGQGCRLVAAPLGLETVEEIELLLSIVDYIDLKNGCVEVISPVRSATDAAFKRALMGSTAVAV